MKKRVLRERIAELERELAIARGEPRPHHEGLVWIDPSYVIGNNVSTTVAPWCHQCGGFHVPGFGACTATFS